jgi:ATPase
MIEGRVVLDTSVIIDGKVSELIISGDLPEGAEIIVPMAALDELQSQASRHRDEGFTGLKELTKLRELCDQKKITLSYTGVRPTMEDIRLARGGRIDALIRDTAKEKDATLLTADYVQALVGSAQGIKVRHFKSEVKTKGLEFERFFDDQTLSVHLKEGVQPFAKKGLPGNFVYRSIGENEIQKEQLEAIVKEIAEASRVSPEGSIEISRSGASVYQLGAYRIAIARPPFSDSLEVTIVRPLVRMTLKDYELSEKLEQRLAKQAEGVLIAGPPGSGKSTLASSLADFYLSQMKVVKTFESPKDLQVSKGITQYGALEGDFDKTAEILLLVRPDYTIYDEVRKTRDFEIFADMRLAGVGMVGVVHASDPINAVQRFMGRIELGMIPHIVDTVIFVKAGRIQQVLDLNLVVKVPTGMNEPDLARPVVEVREFETGKLAFEIYTFGEENVIIPIKDVDENTTTPRGVEKLAAERILQVIRKFDPNAEAKIISPQKAEIRIADSIIPRVIGRGGAQIKELEEMLSIHIDVKSREGSDVPEGNDGRLDFDLKERGSSFALIFRPQEASKRISIYSNEDLILETTLGKKGVVDVPRKSEVGKKMLRALRKGDSIKAFES